MWALRGAVRRLSDSVKLVSEPIGEAARAPARCGERRHAKLNQCDRIFRFFILCRIFAMMLVVCDHENTPLTASDNTPHFHRCWFTPISWRSIVCSAASKPPLFILHGLYGRGRNLRTVSERIASSLPEHPVHIVDMRNHGDSPHSPVHTYPGSG